MIKTEEQLEGIRRSSILTRDLLDMLEERIQAGVTTNQINEWVHEETLAQGADPAPLNYGRGKGPRGKPFPKSVCTSINEVICHGIPNERILADGDIINVDVTCNLDGYFGDASRMFIIGEIPDSTRELVEETKKCLELGIAQVRPGGRTGDIGYAIQNHAESLGYSVVRDFCGHRFDLNGLDRAWQMVMRTWPDDIIDLPETFDYRLFLRIDDEDSSSEPDHSQDHQDQQTQVFLGHSEFEFSLKIVEQFINVRGGVVFVPRRFIGWLVPFHSEDLVRLALLN